MRFELNARTLSNLLSAAKDAHSNLPADYPEHKWQDWYAEFMITELLRTSHVEACEVCSVAFGYTQPYKHDGTVNNPPSLHYADPEKTDKCKADITECWNNELGRAHVHVIFIIEAIALILYGLFF